MTVGNYVLKQKLPEFLLAECYGDEGVVGPILPLHLQPLGPLHYKNEKKIYNEKKIKNRQNYKLPIIQE